jgi:hypothetical protein
MLPSIRNSASENLLQAHQDLFRRKRAFETLEHLPIPSDQEFREIPGDVLVALFVWISRLEEFIESAGAVAIDLDFFEHRKGSIEFGPDELDDLLVGAGFLAAELVAGEGENSKARFFIVVV